MKSGFEFRHLALRYALALVVSICVLPVLTPAFAAQQQEAAPFVSDRISVEVMGQGTDIIFLHGYASTREVWRPVAERLSGQYRVHLVQMAGFAGAPWGHGDGAYFQPMLDEVARYAATLDRPVFIGHSMGGLSGLMLAEQHPELLSKVMSVDSLPFFGVLMDVSATPDSVRPMAEQMRAVIRSAPAFLFRAQQQQTAVSLTLKEDRRAEIVTASDGSNRQALATAIAELMTTDMRPVLGQITTPVWVVYAVDHSGGQGAIAPSVWSREYAPLPNVTLEPIENSRHFIMYDQPERLNALIDRFLEDK